MTDNQNLEPPTIISHLSVGTAQFEKAIAFYDQVLATVGAKRVFDEPEFKAVGYGKQYPEFWVQEPFNHEPPSVGNGNHVAFLATTKQAVHEFYQAAIDAGATCDGEPGPRPQYSDAYYGCFVRDLDGHKIEAMYWDEAQQ